MSTALAWIGILMLAGLALIVLGVVAAAAVVAVRRSLDKRDREPDVPTRPRIHR